jgi:hypothetical protein
MDLDFCERIRRLVKIVIAGLGAILVVMMIVAAVTGSLRSGDDSRRAPGSTGRHSSASGARAPWILEEPRGSAPGYGASAAC